MEYISPKISSKTPMLKSKLYTDILPELNNQTFLNRTLDTIQLNETIKKFNKHKFRLNLNPGSIAYIESKVRNGDNSLTTDKLPRPLAESPDPNTLNLKKLHCPDTRGKFVLKLPKLPYGKHESYNNEEKFLEKYICDQHNITRDVEIQVEKVHRQFKYLQKLKPRSLSPHKTSKKFSKYEDFHVYNNRAGNLICAIQKSAVAAYVEHTNKYSQLTALPRSHHSLHPKLKKSSLLKSSSKKLLQENIDFVNLSPTKYDDKYKPLFTSEGSVIDLNRDHMD